MGAARPSWVGATAHRAAGAARRRQGEGRTGARFLPTNQRRLSDVKATLPLPTRRPPTPYLVAHTIPRRTIARASGTSKSLAWWPSEQ